MDSLKALCFKHGGKFTTQSGTRKGESRDYWLLFETFQALASGHISRCAQIERSWGMWRHLEVGWKRNLPCYSLVFITKGHGVFQDESSRREIPVQKGDLLCLFPGHPHAYAPPRGQCWDEINIEFSGPVFDPWTGIGLLDPAVPVRHLVPSGDDKLIQHWMKKFYAVALPLAGRAMAEPDLADAGRLIALIAEMCATWRPQANDADAEWANRAKRQLLELPLREQPDFAELAGTFGIGEQAYRKKFKRLCGVSPFAFRSRQLIEAASHELICTNKPIKEIGYDLGYGSLYYFSRKFKQVTGKTPGDYRKLTIN
jgi:AraC-like DNA-binding protein